MQCHFFATVLAITLFVSKQGARTLQITSNAGSANNTPHESEDFV